MGKFERLLGLGSDLQNQELRAGGPPSVNKDIHMIVSHPEAREHRDKGVHVFAAVERVRRGCSSRKSAVKARRAMGDG